MRQVQELKGKTCTLGGRLFSRLGRSIIAASVLATVLAGSALAEDSTVHGTVRVLHRAEGNGDSADVVISLTPLQARGMVRPGATPRLVQKNKKFTPHVVVVTQGTEIEFPNQDLFFHNVFSIHQGKTFDLGLYESGAARKIKFTQPGVSYIFCNIHPQMSAVVVVLRTQYFALSDAEGNFQISHVLPGRYKLAVWYELTPESELTAQGKEIEVDPGDNAIDRIVLHSTDAPPEHPNKDGDPYYSGPSKTR